ncbi:PAAR domain-containing protein [Sphingomonas caeni]|uniref:PAAR domain-containing protein n=1 Tax=Sphingomonas caeni TaxID=2984949 RepID=UPI00223180AD|nr:PAAR domain-containing protein [Sphingomonas caeni]
MHKCPAVNPGPSPHVGGPVAKGSSNVITGGAQQARVTDKCVCKGPPDVIVKGSATVLVNGLPAARQSDSTAHGGKIVAGCATVLIGDAGGGGVADMGAADGFAPPADPPCLKAGSASGSPFMRTS